MLTKVRWQVRLKVQERTGRRVRGVRKVYRPILGPPKEVRTERQRYVRRQPGIHSGYSARGGNRW